MVNLISAEKVARAFGERTLLDSVSLGIATGDRIGVVGRNGAGKSTLLSLLAGTLEPDSGRIARTAGLRIGYLRQRDELSGTVRQAVFGPGASEAAEHRWASDPRARGVVAELLGGIDLGANTSRLSGGERRRTALASLLVSDVDVLLLDEPTNHLDLEAIDWLGRHLRDRGCALVVVSHDRWLLDTACDRTWEVESGQVYAYDGGYSAYVLAQAERERNAETVQRRRRSLMRKELAWLRRGPQARSTKPKFRVQAANALIADEPPVRDTVELTSLATARLGKTVIDVEDVTLWAGPRVLLDDVTWQLAPGERAGLVGVNGSGKTSFLRLLDGSLVPARPGSPRRRPARARARARAARIRSGPWAPWCGARPCGSPTSARNWPSWTPGAGCSRRSRTSGRSSVSASAKYRPARCWSGSASAGTSSGPRSANCPAGSGAGCSCSGC